MGKILYYLGFVLVFFINRDKEEKKRKTGTSQQQNLTWPRKTNARFGISDLDLDRIRSLALFWCRLVTSVVDVQGWKSLMKVSDHYTKHLFHFLLTILIIQACLCCFFSTSYKHFARWQTLWLASMSIFCTSNAFNVSSEMLALNSVLFFFTHKQ